MLPHVDLSTIEPFSHSSKNTTAPRIYSQGHIRDLPHLGVQFPDIAGRDEFSEVSGLSSERLTFRSECQPMALETSQVR